MELQHSFRVPIGIGEAWTTFNDLERIAPCLPGAQLTSVEGDEFAGKAKVKVGPVTMQFAGTGRFVERDEAGYRAVIEATGKDSRGNGTASATVTARLQADGDGTTVLVDTDLKVTGKVAQFGKGMISEIGGKLLDQFAACLATTLAEPEAQPEPESQPEVASIQDVEPADLRPAGAGPVAAPDPSVPSATSPGVTPTPSQTGRTAPIPPRRPLAEQPEPAALDLGSVLWPTLLRRYGPLVAAGLVGGLLGWLFGRRGRAA